MFDLKLSILFMLEYNFAIISTIYIHEAGHYLTAKLFKFKIEGFRMTKFLYIIPMPTAVKLSPGILEKYNLDNISEFNVKYILIILSGVFAGAVPIGIYLYYCDSIVWTVFIGILYTYMCSSDLMKLIDFLRGNLPYEEQEITVTIPESSEECESVHPECSQCGYFIVKECTGDKSIFPFKYRSNDVERLSKILEGE